MTRTYAAYVFVAALIIVSIGASSRSIREDIAYYRDPSAEHAFRIGISHLDTPHPGEYDIERARKYFEKGAALNAAFPYIHHQLARIHFLQGRYEEALAEVNIEIENDTKAERAPSYYLRGLIKGYMNDHESAVADYKKYVELNPQGWEGRVDYAWVLIKTQDYKTALAVVDEGLADERWRQNPWLLSMKATIQYEMGDVGAALTTIRLAKAAVDTITPLDWMKAYPGNDPSVAETGIATIRQSVTKNFEVIEAAAKAL